VAAVQSAPVRRALVVDDDPEVRRALGRLLRPELDVSLAGSVSDAKAIVARLDRLDVAFVDWELPDGTGEEVLEWLSRWPDAIRVLISARFASNAGPHRSAVQAGELGDAAMASSRCARSETQSAETQSAETQSAETQSAETQSAETQSAETQSEWSHECSTSRSGEKSREGSSEGLLKSNPLKNRALANLVLGKPVATSVIDALKRAALALPND
jgi:DNA-binding NtrC family response regulator